MKPETVMVRTNYDEATRKSSFTWESQPPAIWFEARAYPEAVPGVRAKGYRFLERPHDRFEEIWVRPFPRWLVHRTGHQAWSGYHAVRRWLYLHKVLNVRNDWKWSGTVRLSDLRPWPLGKRV